MGADFLEQDVVASRDGQLIVFHDLHLDQLTDVAQRFPGRARPDGMHYCIDFSLRELQSLRVTERRRQGGAGARFPGRFPLATGTFRLHTLEEELEFIQGLNRSTGRRAGVYAEIKAPAWHREHNFELGDRLIETLREFGYRTRDDGFFVQCFSGTELRRVRDKFGGDVPLIQLLDEAPTSVTREVAGKHRRVRAGHRTRPSVCCGPTRASSGWPTSWACWSTRSRFAPTNCRRFSQLRRASCHVCR